ncbi:MAG: gluconate transporter [Sphingobacteriales bacterium]|nr:MAG: gluconate transporter [Sphingobacteriales bacterium]
MTLLTIVLCILSLVILISWGKINAFLAFLLVSIITGLLLGIPLSAVTSSVQKGIGDTLGSLVIVISLGAMLGKLVAESGAAQQIASTMMSIFGVKYIQWALMATGFVVGIPLFYNVGFVLMIPLIFSVVYQYKLPAVYIGLPMLASLSVTHGFLPPHPAPTALVAQFNANMGLTLLYGLAVAIPAIIVAGPVFSRSLKGIVSVPLKTFQVVTMSAGELPGRANSFLSSLLPVILLMATTALPYFLSGQGTIRDVALFISEPTIVMLIALIVATYTLGINMGKSMSHLMNIYSDAVKDISMIIFIVAGAGALKQVFVDSGVSNQIASVLQTWNIHPLILGWLIACIIRVCIGSATVAGLTTAGIMAPILTQSNANPNLMVLSIGAGSLMFSHVNDGGFWMFKEYFNLSMKDTLRSWSLMETIVAVVGLIGVMILNTFV